MILIKIRKEVLITLTFVDNLQTYSGITQTFLFVYFQVSYVS